MRKDGLVERVCLYNKAISDINRMKMVEAAGLFKRERVGNSVYYMLDEEVVEQYRQDMYHAFDHASTPCPYEFKCDTCPVKETCI